MAICNNFLFFLNGRRQPFWKSDLFFIIWLSVAILDDRKSLSIAFLAISDQYATFFFFTKWLLSAILDDRKSLLIALLTISDQNATFFLLEFFFKMAAGGHFGNPICAKNNRVLPPCVINGYAKYVVDRLIYDTVRDATSFLSIFIQNGHQRPFCFSD